MQLYDEDGTPTTLVQQPAINDEPISERDLSAAIQALQRVLMWVWQSGPVDNNGMEIRAIIACWIFLSHLRPMTLPQIAHTSGRDKQAIDRWVQNFKKAFPEIKCHHFKKP